MTDTRSMIAGERRDLSALLSALTDEQWNARSLCDGWRVREVVAHMTAPFRTGRADYELGETPDDINARADHLARADAAALTSAELAASTRDNVDHPWEPLGGGPTGALSHDVIHGLDITEALGLDRRVPLPRIEAVLAGLAPDNIAFFGVDLTGVKLVATDLDWTYGSGEPRAGTAQELLLVLVGRSVDLRRVS